MIGKHRIIRKLGEGGMGVVYEAFDESRDTRVALKTLLRVHPQSLLAFKREFRSLQDLEHPCLVQLYELGVADDIWYLTMELVEGRDLLTYLRGMQSGGDAILPHAAGETARHPDERHVRAVFSQLSDALCTLHRAGKVHRDIKPSNVLVTDAGRVVVLDFGLVFELSLDSRVSGLLTGAGTPAYMAPEQVMHQPISSATDWYAVGVMLFQVLTGQLPFTGTLVEVLTAKKQEDPPHPRGLVPTCWQDLADLCHLMMAVNPAKRPRGEQIAFRLGANISAPSVPSPPAETPGPVFVGRARELARLRAAYDRVMSGTPATVLIRGESGVGKSALIHQFINAVKSESEAAVVLVGRCHERESVPYKALDGVMDRLSQYMRRLPGERAASLLPRHASLLVRLFPVLGRVKAMAQAPPPRRPSNDPHLLAQEAFTALRELFQRLGERYPLIVVIDDLQWSDRDSEFLLAHLLSAPDAPVMLVLGSMRVLPSSVIPLSVADEQVSFHSFSLHDDVQLIELGPLAPDDALELAERLLGQGHGPTAADAVARRKTAEQITTEAHGHPMSIGELVHTRRQGPGL